MLFHTWIFAVFFLIVYPVHWVARGTRFGLWWLLLASYVFYGWWNPLYLVLIAYSTLIDYAAVTFMARGGRKKLWLWASIVNHVALLGFFKYGAFVARNVNAALAGLGVGHAVPEPGLLLPVGISFYTFQAMSYTIDFYRGEIEREPSLVRFATFVSLFPQLVAGPIERAKHLLPQLRGRPAITGDDVATGFSLFAVGLFKKVALADYLGRYVDRVYATPSEYGAAALLLATFAFAWQIYFDFSGYTDMARGVARMMGFRLMLNFNNPYLSTSLREFWQRWHISLSTWFKDYVYIPLGGNRHGTFNTYRNMVITMVVSGLWHGAAWTFVIWGALHALGRVATRALESSAFYRERVPKTVKQAFVFAFVGFAWIFFRAQSFSDAVLIVTRIFAGAWSDPRFPMLALALVLAVWAYQFLYESKARAWLETAPVRVGVTVLLLVYLVLSAGGGPRPFIYFQF